MSFVGVADVVLKTLSKGVVEIETVSLVLLVVHGLMSSVNRTASPQESMLCRSYRAHSRRLERERQGLSRDQALLAAVAREKVVGP